MYCESAHTKFYHPQLLPMSVLQSAAAHWWYICRCSYSGQQTCNSDIIDAKLKLIDKICKMFDFPRSSHNLVATQLMDSSGK